MLMAEADFAMCYREEIALFDDDFKMRYAEFGTLYIFIGWPQGQKLPPQSQSSHAFQPAPARTLLSEAMPAFRNR